MYKCSLFQSGCINRETSCRSEPNHRGWRTSNTGHRSNWYLQQLLSRNWTKHYSGAKLQNYWCDATSSSTVVCRVLAAAEYQWQYSGSGETQSDCASKRKQYNICI